MTFELLTNILKCLRFTIKSIRQSQYQSQKKTRIFFFPWSTACCPSSIILSFQNPRKPWNRRIQRDTRNATAVVVTKKPRQTTTTILVVVTNKECYENWGPGRNQVYDGPATETQVKPVSLNMYVFGFRLGEEIWNGIEGWDFLGNGTTGKDLNKKKKPSHPEMILRLRHHIQQWNICIRFGSANPFHFQCIQCIQPQPFQPQSSTASAYQFAVVRWALVGSLALRVCVCGCVRVVLSFSYTCITQQQIHRIYQIFLSALTCFCSHQHSKHFNG